MNKLLIFPILTVFIISCNQPKSETTTTEKQVEAVKDSLSVELDSIYKSGKIIGFGVSIADENGILYSKGFGYADKATKTPYSENTIQHIASVSKTLIGISLMKAQEMGKLNLDDPIESYLPFKVIHPLFPAEKITIRQLAQHTSGINDTEQYMESAWILKKGQDLTNIRTDYPEQRFNPAENDVPMETYLREYLTPQGTFYQSDNFINFRPGTRYNYSNIGATLAALIIEKATGVPFNEFTETHILKPLGMTHSGWFLEDVDQSKHSKLYRNDYSELPFYGAITYPDGMLITSPNDMGKYLAELIKGYAGKGTLLTRESYVEYFREQLQATHFDGRDSENPYNEDYSPALFIGHSAKGYVGHSGGDAGVGTWMYFNKETLTGRFIVINTDMGEDNRAKELEFYAVWDKMEEYLERLKKQR